MNGLLIINKDSGMTSRDIVNRVSKVLEIKKVGHTGTLDPLATGVLILCVGDATKISKYITSYDKVYEATVMLGIETDTLDITGSVLYEADVNVDKNDIVRCLSDFIGNIKQMVPKYSAVKVSGMKLYDYARKNIDVDLPIKDICIYSLDLISDIYELDGKICFDIRTKVSKGTYIRSLIRDIGHALGTYATMVSLKRVKQGEFSIDSSQLLSDIENGNYKLINIDNALFNMEKVVVEDELIFKVKNGMVLPRFFKNDVARIYDSSDNLLAIYKTYDKNTSLVKPDIVFWGENKNEK